jgi:hypothetical protein
LGKNLLRRRGKEFWDFHIKGLKTLGCSLEKVKLLKGTLASLYFDVVNFLAHPKRNTRFFLQSIKQKTKTANN